MATNEPDTSRSVVKTYVPAYQKAEWQNHADELDMSQSEFVRSMVQAGRRSFDPTAGSTPTDREDSGNAAADTEPADESDDAAAPLDSQVAEALAREDYLSWDELMAQLTDDIEQRLEGSMERLQRQNRVGYSGRRGGYELLEDDVE